MFSFMPTRKHCHSIVHIGRFYLETCCAGHCLQFCKENRAPSTRKPTPSSDGGSARRHGKPLGLFGTPLGLADRKTGTASNAAADNRANLSAMLEKARRPPKHVSFECSPFGTTFFLTVAS